MSEIENLPTLPGWVAYVQERLRLILASKSIEQVRHDAAMALAVLEQSATYDGDRDFEGVSPPNAGPYVDPASEVAAGQFRQQLSESLSALTVAAFTPDTSDEDPDHDLPSAAEAGSSRESGSCPARWTWPVKSRPGPAARH